MIETKASGKVGCRILAGDDCVSDERTTRAPCAGFERCVDAGDDNGDYVVNSDDSAVCLFSTPTPTAPTDTATPVPTHTPTDTPVPSSTPTETPTDTPEPTSTPTQTPTDTPTPTPSCRAPGGIIIPHVVVNQEIDPQVPVLPPNPDADNCLPQTILGGGCAIQALDGSIANGDNVFDASATIDQMRCPGDPAPSYHWEIFKPIGLGNVLYTTAGVSGYRGPVLTMQPNSLPEVLGESPDIFWRVGLTITSNVTGQSTQVFFRFVYARSQLSLSFSTYCQDGQPHDDCFIGDTPVGPATEPI